MIIYLLRHGQTEYNAEKRYQGTRDIPLSPEGRASLLKADISPEIVYTSPLSRAVDTAKILFPGAEIRRVYDLREMCFGVFEGRNYIEMERDPEYLAWVGEDCRGRCPGGESREEFSNRTCDAFAALTDEGVRNKAKQIVIVAHGGTQMAVMERYAVPHRDYYSWCAKNGSGFVLSTDRWENSRILTLLREVNYLKG